jgi:biopolymer transport protein ExbD
MIDDIDLEQEFEDHLDLTPLIDAMFLLLIFFIMATTFAKPVMDVVLPHAESSEKHRTDQQQMVIVIDSQGRIFHDNREVMYDELPDLLSRQTDLPVNLHVDERAPFQAFIKALDEARMNERDEILITTENSNP